MLAVASIKSSSGLDLSQSMPNVGSIRKCLRSTYHPACAWKGPSIFGLCISAFVSQYLWCLRWMDAHQRGPRWPPNAPIMQMTKVINLFLGWKDLCETNRWYTKWVATVMGAMSVSFSISKDEHETTKKKARYLLVVKNCMNPNARKMNRVNTRTDCIKFRPLESAQTAFSTLIGSTNKVINIELKGP